MTVRRPYIIALVIAGAILAVERRCHGTPPPVPSPPVQDPPQALRGVRLEVFAKGLKEPVHLISPPGDTERIFVVEKTGRIILFKRGERVEAPFLNLSGSVSGASEQGLLSLAFHPRYAQNRRFFLNFTDTSGVTQIVEMRAREDDPDRADLTRGEVLLSVHQPFANHNGGHSLFGPDGYLYIGMGDGGAANDPLNHGQNERTLLGAVLRIDVDRVPAGAAYGIPADNPFADGQRGRAEIWLTGVRNPWRMAFHPDTGDLFVADVGQNKWEEVTVVPAKGGGSNLGWNRTEGMHLFKRGASWDGTIRAHVEYAHAEGQSITGGHVYRGKALPELRGHYFYADYVSGLIRSFRFEGGEVKDHYDWSTLLNPRRVTPSAISSFGEDGQGELYLLSLYGTIYRLSRAAD